MSDRNRKVLYEILQKDGNKECADCKTKENVDWASCNLGIFLCQDCAGIHRSLGVDHSRVKSIKLDNWDDEQVKKMAEAGNENVNKYYEQHLPKYYKQPTKNDKDVLKIQFIKAKYVRKEFIYPDKQAPYSENKKEGQLFKKGRDRRDYLPRNFIVNSKENCIQYYNKNEGPALTWFNALPMKITWTSVKHDFSNEYCDVLNDPRLISETAAFDNLRLQSHQAIKEFHSIVLEKGSRLG